MGDAPQLADQFPVGCLVATRGREWVVLPSPDQDVLLLRPLAGADHDACGIYLPMEGAKVRQAVFPPPDPATAADFVAARLVRDAARLSLRSGAGPFRSLGRIAVRPRPYQFVPLIMALRLDPVRLLISDDVGVGKTIETAMIARELLDRGDARRLCVLCPPHLCDQWQRELEEKFGISAVIVRSNTLARLERDVQPSGTSVYEYYPHVVVSIDFAKLDTRKHDLLAHASDLVIVDEAHGAARPGGSGRNDQQLRYELVHNLARNKARHLILVTATPHSGIEASFQSLLGLLDPKFEALDLQQIGDRDRGSLARHFVQRARIDVRKWMGTDTQFPTRVAVEVPYSLSPAYRELFESVRAFTRDLIKEPGLSLPRQRVRYWAALALLRCVMSSPDAAVRAFDARMRAASGEVDEDLRRRETMDPIAGEMALDAEPEASIGIAVAEAGLGAERKLRLFRRQTEAIVAGGQDLKIEEAANSVAVLLREGFRPIIYCRYVATANYVAAELEKRLRAAFRDLHIVAVTGETGSDEEREAHVAALTASERRVLVATDCLSEGVNLQEHFDAVVHYDLPWNPNRLEQREGRVDRYGQPRDQVRAVLMFGTANPIDAAVLRVLIRKAREIHKRLGISVPVPVDSETVVNAVIEALFQGKDVGEHPEQLSLDLEGFANVTAMHQEWDRRGERERESRTRFAQRAIKPDEIASELSTLDDVLGDPEVVRGFFVEAAQRLGIRIQRKDRTYVVEPSSLHGTARERLGWKKRTTVAFEDGRRPDVDETVILGRTHPLISSMADQILGEAFEQRGSRLFSRCGAAYTAGVVRRTVITLLRIRYRLTSRRSAESFAEEVVTTGFCRKNGDITWYGANDRALLDLLEKATPSGNISRQDRASQVQWALSVLERAGTHLAAIAKKRAAVVEASHAKLQQYAGAGAVRVHAYPPDVLGVYVFIPRIPS